MKIKFYYKSLKEDTFGRESFGWKFTYGEKQYGAVKYGTRENPIIVMDIIHMIKLILKIMDELEKI